MRIRLFVIPIFVMISALLFVLTASTESKSKLDWQNSFKIGIVCQLSGPHAQIGTKYFKEISSYVFKINASGGIGGRALYVGGPPIIKNLPPELQQYKNNTFFKFNNKRQMSAINDGRTYAEYVNAFVFDAYNDVANGARSIDCITKLVEKDVLAVLCQASNKSEMTDILETAEKTHTPLILFISDPKLVSLPNNNWVFLSTPSKAIAAVIQAIKQAGSDKEGIRKNLANQLGQRDK